MKFSSKKAVAKRNVKSRRTGGGPNPAPRPTETQFRIANFIGQVRTSGISGTKNCEIAAQVQQSFSDLLSDLSTLNVSSDLAPFAVSAASLSLQPQLDEEHLTACISASSPPSPAKKHVAKRDQQSQDLLNVEHKIGDTVENI